MANLKCKTTAGYMYDFTGIILYDKEDEDEYTLYRYPTVNEEEARKLSEFINKFLEENYA